LEAKALRSRSHHTPFDGHALPARVRWTLVGGRIAYEG
jgi:dihydroorotase